MPLHVSSTMCSSSGGPNCIIQHLVSSHSVGGRPVQRLREDILSSFRITVCYTSSTNERTSSPLTDNLKQSVQKVEFLKSNFHEFLGAFSKSFQKRLLAASYLSVRPSAWNSSAPNGRIFMKGIFRKSVGKNSSSIKICKE